jgi:hypothetical protein
MNRNCNYCTSPYHAETRYVNRGQGLYCSRSCSSKGNALLRKPKPNVVCAYCGIDFYKNKSKQNTSKSGLYFCTRKHKDLAQKLGGIPEIMPPHYGTGIAEDYRTKAFLAYPPECRQCGWKEYPQVLEVNHIDCDRTNNDLSNLEILCPTCHRVFHFTTKTGPWGRL